MLHTVAGHTTFFLTHGWDLLPPLVKILFFEQVFNLILYLRTSNTCKTSFEMRRNQLLSVEKNIMVQQHQS